MTILQTVQPEPYPLSGFSQPGVTTQSMNITHLIIVIVLITVDREYSVSGVIVLFVVYVKSYCGRRFL